MTENLIDVRKPIKLLKRVERAMQLKNRAQKRTYKFQENIGNSMHQHKKASLVSPSTVKESHGSLGMINESHKSPTNHVLNRDVMPTPMTLDKIPQYEHEKITQHVRSHTD